MECGSVNAVHDSNCFCGVATDMAITQAAKFWVEVKHSGVVFVSEDEQEAQAKYKEWCDNQDYEVILYADLQDGQGTVICKRH